MMIWRTLRGCWPALMALTLLACAGGTPMPHRYYLIDPVDSAPLTQTEPLAVEIVGLELPQYLERFQLATRVSSTELRYSETHQWAESLRKNLLRTLARNLAQRLGTPGVGTPLARSATRPDLRVQISIEAFERTADGPVMLAARWQVLGDEPPRVDSFRETLASTEPLASDDYPGIVAAMRTLYGELSDRIARTMLDAVETER